MDLTDKISFSKSFDLAGQNKVLKDPGQVYSKNYQHRSIFGRFGADFGRFWGSFGDDMGVFWGGPWLVSAWKK